MTKIVCISDTHNEEIPLPDGDILIHAGDATFTGSKSELMKFRKYMERQPHKTKIFVPGNHELTMDCSHPRFHPAWRHWLGDEIKVLRYCGRMEVDGLKIFGTATQPSFGPWAFGRPEECLRQIYADIPDDTNVLITHCPPHGILDQSADGQRWLGSMALRERLDELCDIGNLRLHVFGHIHEGAGQVWARKTRCANVSILDEHYKVKNKPFVITL